MGIKHVGRQGEPFDQDVFMTIKRFRARHPNVPIQVDGGVSLHTAPKLLELGVSRLVVGSGIWKAPSVSGAIQELKEITLERGIYE